MSHRLVLRVAPIAILITALFSLSWSGTAGASTATVDAGSNPTFGSILTDAAGFALYTLDTDHGGMTTCTGACAQVWPALTVPNGTTASAGPGVTGTVSAVVQSDGTDQVTYNGAPLYTFLSDTAPGQVTGNGVAGFFVVKVAAAPPATTPPTTAAPAPTTPASPPTTSKPVTTASGTPGTPPGASSGSPGGNAPASSPAGQGSGTSPSSPAPTSAASAPVAAAGSSPTQAPGALAFTGPGPGLAWLAAAGAGLVVVSLLVLAVTGLRRGGRRASRAGA